MGTCMRTHACDSLVKFLNQYHCRRMCCKAGAAAQLRAGSRCDSQQTSQSQHYHSNQREIDLVHQLVAGTAKQHAHGLALVTAAIGCLRADALQEELPTAALHANTVHVQAQCCSDKSASLVRSCEKGTPLVREGHQPVAQCTQCSGEQQGSCRRRDVQPLAEDLSALGDGSHLQHKQMAVHCNEVSEWQCFAKRCLKVTPTQQCCIRATGSTSP